MRPPISMTKPQITSGIRKVEGEERMSIQEAELLCVPCFLLATEYLLMYPFLHGMPRARHQWNDTTGWALVR